MEEPLGGAALQESTPDTSGTASPIGQTGVAFLFVRGKENKVPALTQTDYRISPGKQQVGILLPVLQEEAAPAGWGGEGKRGQQRGWSQQGAGVRSGQPSSQELSVFGESSAKQTKSCSLLLLPYLVILV